MYRVRGAHGDPEEPIMHHGDRDLVIYIVVSG